MSFHDDVAREALHDWLAERPPLEVPSRDELEDDDDVVLLREAARALQGVRSWDGLDFERALELLTRALLAPAP